MVPSTSPVLRASTHSRVAIALAWLLALLAAPSITSGQSLSAVLPNTRIRVELLTTERSRFGREQHQSLVGILTGVQADTVLLRSHDGSDPIRVPLNATRHVFVSDGPPSRWRSALRGAVVPALTGAALSALSAQMRSRAGDPSTQQQAASSAAWGAATGAVLGAWSPKERWNELKMPLTTNAVTRDE